LPNIVREIRSKKVRWIGPFKRGMTNACKNLVGKHEGILLGITKHG
jgi:hypothetical protein